jgi:hypothetical protein
VPSTQMRCMITASRRAKATIAFFSPRRLAWFRQTPLSPSLGQAAVGTMIYCQKASQSLIPY